MSIRPDFAYAILEGKKSVEFRRRPIADDVGYVLIYATLPVGSLLGWCAVTGQTTESPKDLWNKFKNVSGIAKEKFFDYYAGTQSGTAIMVTGASRFKKPIPLAEVGAQLRAPQSFQYLTDAQADRFFDIAGDSGLIQPSGRTTALF